MCDLKKVSDLRSEDTRLGGGSRKGGRGVKRKGTICLGRDQKAACKRGTRGSNLQALGCGVRRGSAQLQLISRRRRESVPAGRTGVYADSVCAVQVLSE